MREGKPIKIFVAGLAMAALFFFIFSLILYSGRRDTGLKQNKIARIDIVGPIISAGETIEEIKKYSDDDSVAVLLIRIDSPGGAVTPSQEIYKELLRVREEEQKKVIASIGNLGASGGYYIASAAEKIYANPGSIVGSIGVLLELTKFTELFKKIGVDSEVIKSGPYKDIGSPLRESTPEERSILQEVIDDTHRQFIDAVVAGRGLSHDKVTTLADGRIFTGSKAKELEMIDELGGLEDAIKGAALLAGIEGEPIVIKPKKKWGWRYFLENFSSLFLKRAPVNENLGLMYLWRPDI